MRRTLWSLFGLLVVLVGAVFGALIFFHIPSNAAGMAAESVCSAAYVGGRDASVSDLLNADVYPASPFLKAITASRNDADHSVTARFLWIWSRTATLQSGRGCILDLPPDPTAEPYAVSASTSHWPAGDGVTAPKSEDLSALNRVVQGAFVGSGDPSLANARGVSVVQNGKLLVLKDGEGLAPGTALHGWSMTKSVVAMLAIKKFHEAGLALDTPVVDAFPSGTEPPWVQSWRGDDRAKITVADLLYMRAGLAIDESYDPTGDVVQMLYGAHDMAAWSADHPVDHAPGSYWEYLSSDYNILSAVVRAQFPSDAAYWAYPQKALFDPLGIHSAVLETDTSGNWVASSYLWASTGDWTRLGELMLNGGTWRGVQVLPAAYAKITSTPAMADGEGHGYGAGVWLPGAPVGGECNAYPGVPADTLLMEGHWGQMVAAIPSRHAVITRLGWTFNSDQFDECQFISDVVAALPK